ncbi:hypothetical protein M427DRAFT_31137 [Gonapodya prolifera JEL478]|uniref:TTI1 C-terminal TPR domain-containing protein n=1 Tax=Gonapodya prolifera (strain JEL478) TaxID=1344416 RepID=A0A139AI13_GONPJ|nr:hypothetical protein M427DRAFT_31137 [Gonapodya prolifera JEL478]|eukprot:KXS16400.1 hypothetical protein M427DRAFT_31137 [Gonapodya prolifera JEL478]
MGDRGMNPDGAVGRRGGERGEVTAMADECVVAARREAFAKVKPLCLPLLSNKCAWATRKDSFGRLTSLNSALSSLLTPPPESALALLTHSQRINVVAELADLVLVPVEQVLKTPDVAESNAVHAWSVVSLLFSCSLTETGDRENEDPLGSLYASSHHPSLLLSLATLYIQFGNAKPRPPSDPTPPRVSEELITACIASAAAILGVDISCLWIDSSLDTLWPRLDLLRPLLHVPSTSPFPPPTPPPLLRTLMHLISALLSLLSPSPSPSSSTTSPTTLPSSLLTPPLRLLRSLLLLLHRTCGPRAVAAVLPGTLSGVARLLLNGAVAPTPPTLRRGEGSGTFDTLDPRARAGPSNAVMVDAVGVIEAGVGGAYSDVSGTGSATAISAAPQTAPESSAMDTATLTTHWLRLAQNPPPSPESPSPNSTSSPPTAPPHPLALTLSRVLPTLLPPHRTSPRVLVSSARLARRLLSLTTDLPATIRARIAPIAVRAILAAGEEPPNLTALGEEVERQVKEDVDKSLAALHTDVASAAHDDDWKRARLAHLCALANHASHLLPPPDAPTWQSLPSALTLALARPSASSRGGVAAAATGNAWRPPLMESSGPVAADLAATLRALALAVGSETVTGVVDAFASLAGLDSPSPSTSTTTTRDTSVTSAASWCLAHIATGATGWGPTSPSAGEWDVVREAAEVAHGEARKATRRKWRSVDERVATAVVGVVDSAVGVLGAYPPPPPGAVPGLLNLTAHLVLTLGPTRVKSGGMGGAVVYAALAHRAAFEGEAGRVLKIVAGVASRSDEEDLVRFEAPGVADAAARNIRRAVAEGRTSVPVGARVVASLVGVCGESVVGDVEEAVEGVLEVVEAWGRVGFGRGGGQNNGDDGVAGLVGVVAEVVRSVVGSFEGVPEERDGADPRTQVEQPNTTSGEESPDIKEEPATAWLAACSLEMRRAWIEVGPVGTLLGRDGSTNEREQTDPAEVRDFFLRRAEQNQKAKDEGTDKHEFGALDDMAAADAGPAEDVDDFHNSEPHRRRSRTPPPPPPNPVVTFLLRLLRTTTHLTSHPHPPVRAASLRLIRLAVPALAAYPKELTPEIHRAWPNVVARLDDKERFVAVEADAVVGALVEQGKDFVARRVSEVVLRYVKVLGVISRQRRAGAAAAGLAREEAEVAGATASEAAFRFSTAGRLLLGALATIQKLVHSVPLKWADARKIEKATWIFLDTARWPEEVISAGRAVWGEMARVDPDAVYLAAWGIGGGGTWRFGRSGEWDGKEGMWTPLWFDGRDKEGAGDGVVESLEMAMEWSRNVASHSERQMGGRIY